MRYKISVSVPALLSAAAFVFGLIAIIIYSLEMIDRELGTGFIINISLQSLTVYLLSWVLSSFLIFALLKRNRE